MFKLHFWFTIFFFQPWMARGVMLFDFSSNDRTTITVTEVLWMARGVVILWMLFDFSSSDRTTTTVTEVLCVFYQNCLVFISSDKKNVSHSYRKTSNIRCILVSNKIVDHSDVLGHRLSALFQLHLHSWLSARLQWIGQSQIQDYTRYI